MAGKKEWFVVTKWDKGIFSFSWEQGKPTHLGGFKFFAVYNRDKKMWTLSDERCGALVARSASLMGLTGSFQKQLKASGKTLDQVMSKQQHIADALSTWRAENPPPGSPVEPTPEPIVEPTLEPEPATAVELEAVVVASVDHVAEGEAYGKMCVRAQRKKGISKCNQGGRLMMDAAKAATDPRVREFYMAAAFGFVAGR